jgi:hypothetical protein
MSAVAAQEVTLATGTSEEDEQFLHLVEEAAFRPEVMRPAEIDIRLIQTGYLNVFSQQRAGRNEEHEALKNSLREGQINPINIMIADHGTVLDYLAFTNKTWRSDKTEEDLKPLPPRFAGDPDAGKYVILIAGHSRMHALRALVEDEGLDPDAAELLAQVHEVRDVQDILRIQLAENIHSKPHKDRSFRAIAEMYMFLEEKDKAHHIQKRAFAKYFGVSENALRDALNYAALPEEVREMTDDGDLPMGVLIELARSRQAIVDAHTITADNDPAYAVTDAMGDDEEAEVRRLRAQAVTDMTVDTIRVLISRYNKLEKRTVAAGKAIFRTHAEALRRRNAPPKVGKMAVEMDMLFESGISVADQRAMDQKELRDNIAYFFGRDEAAGRALARRLAQLGNFGLEATYLDDVRDGIQRAADGATVLEPVAS